MKIQISQSFAIDDKEYKVKSKGKPAVHENVPAYFCFIAFFISLVKSGAVKILEVHSLEFKDLPSKYSDKDISHEDLEMMHDALENAEVEQDDESEEGDESNEESLNPSDESLSSDPADEIPADNGEPSSDQEPQGSQELQENSGAEQNAEVEEPKKKSADEIEFDSLEEKKLRLTNKEKQRHAELKKKLKGK